MSTLGFAWLSLWRVRWQDMAGRPLEEAQMPIVGADVGADDITWRRWSDEDIGEFLLSPILSSAGERSCRRADVEAMTALAETLVTADATDRRQPGALFLAAALGASSRRDESLT